MRYFNINFIQDTDSIIYEFDDRLGDPLEQYTADQMGWLADEYPSHEIQEIVMSEFRRKITIINFHSF